MEKRICKTCNKEKEITEFYKINNGNSYRGNCKDCVSRKKRDRYKNDPKVRKLAKKHRELNKEKYGVEYRKEYYLKNKLEHYVVYYLPKINYCGVTIHPTSRMYCHVRDGNDTTGWKVLAKAKTLDEALKIESKYHNEMGMNGAVGWKKKEVTK